MIKTKTSNCKGCGVTIEAHKSASRKKYPHLCRSCSGKASSVSHYPKFASEALIKGEEISYEDYLPYKDVLKSRRLIVKCICASCGKQFKQNAKHLGKRKLIDGEFCPNCVMKEVTRNEDWLSKNSEAQKRIQSTPEQKMKNSEGVRRYYVNHPEARVEKAEAGRKIMTKSEVIRRIDVRKVYNGSGISGDFQSRFGKLRFESAFELAVIACLDENSNVKDVKRGPVVDYKHKGVSRIFFVDFIIKFNDGKIIMVEVKSSYIELVDNEKINSKNDAAKKYILANNIDEYWLITEHNSIGKLGVKMPRTQMERRRLIEQHKDKVTLCPGWAERAGVSYATS